MILRWLTDKEIVELKSLYRKTRDASSDLEVIVDQSISRERMMYEVKIGTADEISNNNHHSYHYVDPTRAFEDISWDFRIKIISQRVGLLDEVHLEYIEKRVKLKESSLGL